MERDSATRTPRSCSEARFFCWRSRIASRGYRTLLFWATFVLTRPLGATLGDLLDKPYSHGGLALSRYTASAVIATFMIACLLLLPQRAERLRSM